MSRHLRIFPAIAGLLVLLQCAEPVTEQTAQQTTFPIEGGTLNRRLSSEIATLNFVRSTTLNEKYVISCLQDALVEWNDKLEIQPGLARKWEISPDGRAITFHLDPRATWSDGKPVTSGDLIYTLRAIVEGEIPSPQYAGLFTSLDLKRSRIIDDRTAEIRFTTPRAGLIETFNIPLLPRHIYADRDHSQPDFESVGTGPYVLEERVPGSHIRLVRRDDYWRQKPFIEEVVFRLLEDDTTAWNAMKLGDIDVMSVSSDRWTQERNNPLVQQRMDFQTFYELDYSFIAWNNRHPVLSDPRVRRAMTMSLDRATIIENLYYGTARIITGPFTPDMWAYNQNVTAVRYDLDGAAQLLASAGLSDIDQDGVLEKNGEAVSIDLIVSSGSPISQQIGQILQDALSTIGLTLNVVPLDRATFFARVIEGDFDAAFLAWGIDPDPDVYSTFHSSQIPPTGQNFVYYSNPRADRLIEEGRNELDPAKREAIYRELHAVLSEDQPYTWVVQEAKKWAVNRRIHGVRMARGIGPFLWYPGMRGWWISPQRQAAPAPESDAA
ncbi:MAG: hypothetical protein KY459_16320 [Acidobacteria bacterium]|nr:hypothetical protein [Acidobacteriota bacterium]